MWGAGQTGRPVDPDRSVAVCGRCGARRRPGGRGEGAADQIGRGSCGGRGEMLDVERVLSRCGALVKQGDLFIRIDPSLYAADVARAEGQVAAAKARLI